MGSIKPSAWFALFGWLILALGVRGAVKAELYELTKDEMQDANRFDSTDVSLFGVKLQDTESKAVKLLLMEVIAGVRAEREGPFILLFDAQKPTGPMAGLRMLDGKVDLIFINKRFSSRARGIFRAVLLSNNPDQIRALFGDRCRNQGWLINFLGADMTVEFTLPDPSISCPDYR